MPLSAFIFLKKLLIFSSKLPFCSSISDLIFLKFLSSSKGTSLINTIISLLFSNIFRIADNLVFFAASSNFSLSNNGIYNILTAAICNIVKIPATHVLVILSIVFNPSVSTKNKSSSPDTLPSNSFISKSFLSIISFIFIGP